MKNVQAQNGLEAWRQLSVRYNPYTKGRSIAKLTEILSWNFGGESEFQDKFTEWESVVEEWESYSQELLADSIKSAVLAERAPKVAAEQVRLNSDKLDTYKKIRQCAIDYVVSKNTGPMPMEVNALNKGWWTKGKKGKKGDKCKA